MIEYIEQVSERFENASNHGNGNNWWYPQKNTIAYNVKIYAGASTEDVRKHLTARQNDYYSDDDLMEIMQEQQNDAARIFSDDIDNEYGVKSGYAGRSGGWLEVEYHNDIADYQQNEWAESHIDDIRAAYKEAKKLDQLESDIAEYIKKSVKNYSQYLNGIEYPKDIAESLQTDEDIADTYKGKIKGLTDKLI